MSRRALLIWGLVYLVLIVGVVAGMQMTRSRTIASLSTPQAQADWQAWRDAAEKQAQEGPVRRKVPKSAEPPALTLMRDYYTTLLIAAVFFSSVLYLLFAWVLHNAFFKAANPSIPQKSGSQAP